MFDESALTPNQKKALALLRQARGGPVDLPGSTGARLVELGFARPKPRQGEDRAPFGYGTYELAE